MQTRRGVYHLEGGFAFITFTDEEQANLQCYIHPDADENELNYYCQDPGLRTVLELKVAPLYDGIGLIGAQPMEGNTKYGQ